MSQETNTANTENTATDAITKPAPEVEPPRREMTLREAQMQISGFFDNVLYLSQFTELNVFLANHVSKNVKETKEYSKVLEAFLVNLAPTVSMTVSKVVPATESDQALTWGYKECDTSTCEPQQVCGGDPEQSICVKPTPSP